MLRRSPCHDGLISHGVSRYRRLSVGAFSWQQLHCQGCTVMALSISTQVPQDEWGGYPGIDKDEEIPCRRMRSSSYVKAMGDDESGDSDSSPKTSPQKAIRPDALALKSVMLRPHIDPQR